MKTGSEPTGQARDHLPIYKLDLADPISGVPGLKKSNFISKNLKTTFLFGVLDIIKNLTQAV